MIVIMTMTMAVAVAVTVTVAVAMMGMPESSQANYIHKETENANDEKFVQSRKLATLCKSAKRIKDYFNANKPA